jgi:hypothetical protein
MNIGCHDFILEMKGSGLGQEEMLEPFFEKYGGVVRFGLQPKEAFMINARATIACTLRERGFAIMLNIRRENREDKP